MPTLEQIAETGIFSLGTSGFHREFVPFDEEITVELFANEINLGRLSVRDAYINFWSYVEDKELWGLERFEDEDLRAILPAWDSILVSMSHLLSEDNLNKFLEEIVKPYFAVKEVQRFFGPSYSNAQDYNPFVHNLAIATAILSQSKRDVHNVDLVKKILIEIESGLPAAGFAINNVDRDQVVEGVYSAVGYNKDIVGHLYSKAEFFGINRKDPSDMIAHLEGTKTPHDLVQMIKERIISSPASLEKYGWAICHMLRLIDSPESRTYLDSLVEFYGHIKDIDSFRKQTMDKGKADISQNAAAKPELEELETRIKKFFTDDSKDSSREYGLCGIDDPRLVPTLERDYLSNPKYYFLALRCLIKIAKGNMDEGKEMGYRAREAVLRYIRRDNSVVLKLYDDFLDIYRQPVSEHEQRELLHFFTLKLASFIKPYGIDENNRIYHWSEKLATMVERGLVQPLLIKLLEEGTSNAANGLKHIPTQESYLALVAYIKNGMPNSHYVMSHLGEMENIANMEKMTKTGILDIVLEKCRTDGQYFYYGQNIIIKMGGEKAIKVIADYFEEVNRGNPDHFESAGYDGLGFIAALEALNQLGVEARKKGWEIPNSLSRSIEQTVVKEGKLISWHDEALRAINPRRHILFGMEHIPRNYGSPGIAPLYNAAMLAHNSLKPQGYNPPVKRLAA